jgi:SAM-dependent methyltransferase
MDVQSIKVIDPSKYKKTRFIISCVESISKKTAQKNFNILDVGCGGGEIAVALAKMGHSVFGIDIKESNIRSAISISEGNSVVFKVLDAFQIDTFKQEFDVVICSEVLEHFEKPEILCSKIAHQIKKGGTLIVTMPNGCGPYELLYELPNRYIRKIKTRIGFPEKVEIADEHKVNITLRRLNLMLKKNGFKVLTIKNSDFISFFPFLRRTKFANLDCWFADQLPYFVVSGWYVVYIFEGSLNKVRNKEK